LVILFNRFKKCKFLALNGETKKKLQGGILKEFFAVGKDLFTLKYIFKINKKRQQARGLASKKGKI
jgi:hypothetical protein